MEWFISSHIGVWKKHPQLDPKPHRADPVALYNARPQRAAPVVVDLNPALWPGQFTSDGMQPSTDANEENNKRRLRSIIGSVTISISWRLLNYYKR